MSNPTNPVPSVEELRKLLAEAFTARPWSVDPDERAGGAAQIVRSAHGRLTTTVAFMSTGRHNNREEDDADAALIVAAVNALPSLLDSLATTRKELAEARETIEGLRGERVALEQRLNGRRHEVEQLQQVIDAIGKGSGLTDEQSKRLTAYVADYMRRGVQGVWYELAQAIAAMLQAISSLQSRLEQAEGLAEALRQIEQLTYGGKGESAVHIIASAALSQFESGGGK